jgi:hypothetical protein
MEMSVSAKGISTYLGHRLNNMKRLPSNKKNEETYELATRKIFGVTILVDFLFGCNFFILKCVAFGLVKVKFYHKID